MAIFAELRWIMIDECWMSGLGYSMRGRWRKRCQRNGQEWFPRLDEM